MSVTSEGTNGRYNLGSDESNSYYQDYNEDLDFSAGVVNMFAYVRVSTQLQAQYGSSIDTQINLLEHECSKTQYDKYNKPIKYNLIRIYIDDGISAKNIEDRHGLVGLMKYVSSLVSGRTHQKLGLMVTDLSRLTRSSKDLETIFEWVKRDSIKLKFIDSSIDTTTDSGMLMVKMLASFFEFERRNSAFKTKLTLRSMSENGTLTGHCSYGWTTGKNDSGRKINIPVEEEQEGLNAVLDIINSQMGLKACEIKNIMNESNILCLRGPGKNFRGNTKPSDKNIARNLQSTWTGKWTTQIIEKIIEHAEYDERKKLVEENNKRGEISILDKDAKITDLIKEYLEETNGYADDNFNISAIARMIDSKNLFSKKVNRSYIKQLMVEARIINPEIEKEKVKTDLEIVEDIKGYVKEFEIKHYNELTNYLLDMKVPLVGKRKNWNKTNVRDLCIKYGIKWE